MFLLHSSVCDMHNLCYVGNAEVAKAPILYCYMHMFIHTCYSPLSMHTCLNTYTYTPMCAEMYNTQGLSSCIFVLPLLKLSEDFARAPKQTQGSAFLLMCLQC